MEKRLMDSVRKAFSQHYTVEEIRHSMQSQGYLEQDIDEALNQVSKDLKISAVSEKNKAISHFIAKEVFDKIGYGFGSQQFINILFMHTGAGFFLVGLINGIRAILSVLISSYLTKYSELKIISKRYIGNFGILFGFSFMGIAFARFFKSVPLFILSLFLGIVGVVSHGDLYQRLFTDTLRKEKRGVFLQRIATYGVLIIGLCILLSGYLMTLFPETGTTITIFGRSFRAYGYLISFEITALAFILSGHILSLVKEKTPKISHSQEYSEYWLTLKHQAKKYLRNPTTLILLLCGTIAGVVEVLGYSYYGIYIYETFKAVALKGYINVAVVFLIAIVFSVISPKIAQKVSKRYGKVPMLVFGSILLSVLPFTFYFNPTLWTIAAAAAISVVGSSLTGLASGLLLNDIIVSKNNRRLYFSMFSLIITIPYIITVPIGAWYAQTYTLRPLFLWLGIIMLVVALLYFLILLTHRREII